MVLKEVASPASSSSPRTSMRSESVPEARRWAAREVWRTGRRTLAVTVQTPSTVIRAKPTPAVMTAREATVTRRCSGARVYRT